MIKQNIFNFKLKTSYENDNFFVSQSNELAHKVLLSDNNSEKYLYLKGPSKSGKSHLGLLWKNINKALQLDNNNFDKIIKYKSNVFIDNFKLLLNEEKIFHLINHCYNNNLRILITSKYSPFEYIFKIKDLSSRVKSFYFVEILQPDDQLINHLLIKLLYDRQIQINNDDIISFILKRINRTYLDIYTFVDKIDKLSLSKKKQITIPLIKELL